MPCGTPFDGKPQHAIPAIPWATIAVPVELIRRARDMVGKMAEAGARAAESDEDRLLLAGIVELHSDLEAALLRE